MYSPRISRFLSAALAVGVGLTGALIAAGPAQANPTSSAGSDQYVTSSVSLSDSTPIPGDIVTFTVHTQTASASFLSAGLAFSAAWGTDFTLDSCGGAITTADCAVVNNTVVYAHAPSGDSTVTISLRVGDNAQAGTAYTVTPFVDYYADNASRQLVLAPTLGITIDAAYADLAIGLTATSGLLTNRVAYTMTARNVGPNTLRSATVVTTLPVAAVSISSPDGCTLDATRTRVSCQVATLNLGATVNRRFTVTYPLLTIGLALNTTSARTASSPADPNPANDRGSDRCVAITPVLISC